MSLNYEVSATQNLRNCWGTLPVSRFAVEQQPVTPDFNGYLNPDPTLDVEAMYRAAAVKVGGMSLTGNVEVSL